MHIFRKIEDVPADYGPTVVSVGNFDGVHRAHQLVLQQVVARGRELGIRSLAVTFEPHPSRILRPGSAPKLITPLARKLELLGASGVDATLVLPFNANFSKTTPEDFVRTLLQQALNAREVHEGENFQFGHRAEGNVTRLVELGKQYGFAVEIYPQLKIRGEIVSSSRIRDLLRQGQVDKARHLLGRAFSIAAPPARGRGYGTRFTVPTINLEPYPELIPKNGVYITATKVNDECFDSVTNIGNRPTFGADSFTIETHLLNFHPIEIKPETEVEISFLRRLRDEIKFPSTDTLREQIGKDVGRAQRFFRLRGVPAR